ncbi:MAG: hypothetical protein F6J86_10310 [Symploca sp. SIO1B1]|nr:hypothetical protein [Symploca sp. SIO1B1]
MLHRHPKSGELGELGELGKLGELGELRKLGKLGELGDKRELIAIGYKAQEIPPKISFTRLGQDKEDKEDKVTRE